ncbi:PLP-dependent transferase [Roseomonas sp. GC11]|uniref:O-acetylhomoserine aminocarboxypropyltransferase/cysteine synthase family protein n=1 Tax=Roseomonas sp. GC11 TaxID=2950546 RepID=UPI00210B59D9|nr:PLP-dependent transferase [Roseomonas sp. GC11]MCQ4160356.1 PLP-dependent transferase [Roseomonas sp. GC11]
MTQGQTTPPTPPRALPAAGETAHPETLALHAGWRAAPGHGAVAVPIVQSTSYQFDSSEHARALFALEQLGFTYSRTGNPTVDVLEKRLAALEGGAAALALGSGQAASAFAVLGLARAGDNIVSSTDLYGGTWNLFANTLKRFGIETRFVDPADPAAFARASDARTRAWYGETLPNPKLAVFPIAEVAELGRPLGIPLILDNTAAPLLARPFDHGAAIIVYSATKYLGGHGTSIAGAIIDSGRFDWSAHPARQPALTEPDPSYHGTIWTEVAQRLGVQPYLAAVRSSLQRDLGAPLSPFNAFQILQGIETLPLRIQRHSETASKVAGWLARQPEVARVIHPSRQSGLQRERAERYLRGGFGGLVGLELAGGHAAGARFIDALKLFYHVANIGDARSLAIHPASTTHAQLSPAEQEASGVTPGYVRLSIGLEHPEDILADLRRGLDAAALRQAA